jgi:hypothetical protein
MPAFGFGLAFSEVLAAVEGCVTYGEGCTQLLSVAAAPCPPNDLGQHLSAIHAKVCL